MAYINRKNTEDAIRKYADTKHSNGEPIEYVNGILKAISVINEQPTADVAEVKHGKWHIMKENPLDETDAPREAGLYRIITADGEETTDYFFGKPTLTGEGVSYWKNCKKIIRAWAKMDGPHDNARKE